MKTKHQIVEDILGHVDWLNSELGCCRCPGYGAHTTKNHRKDCMIYLSGTPALHCFHQSCVDERIEAEKQIRSALIEAGYTSEQLRFGDKKSEPNSKIRELISRAKQLKLRLQSDYRWNLSEIISATNPPESHADQKEALLALFELGDLVWIGGLCETGSGRYADRFKTAFEWIDIIDPRLDEASLIDRFISNPNRFGEFISPSAFKLGSLSRSKDSVKTPRYLVVESDFLGKDEVGAVFNFVRQYTPLRVIVDSGGKSLHGWFDYPDEKLLRELEVILPVLDCDPAMFNPAQPCRMAGVIRKNTGNLQQMIYWEGGAR